METSGSRDRSLSPGVLSLPSTQEIFTNERRITASEYGRGMPRPSLFYVMPFIDGETVRDKLNREKQLGVEEAITLAKPAGLRGGSLSQATVQQPCVATGIHYSTTERAVPHENVGHSLRQQLTTRLEDRIAKVREVVQKSRKQPCSTQFREDALPQRGMIETPDTNLV